MTDVVQKQTTAQILEAHPRTRDAFLRLAALSNKVAGDDLIGNEDLILLAHQYAKGYDGDFSWALEQQKLVQRGGRLSLRQAAGMLNCLKGSASRKIEPEAPAASAFTPKPAGIYTVQIGDRRVTLKLTEAPKTWNKPAGTQIAGFLSGPDNETNYTGFAFVSPRGQVSVWSRFTGDAFSATALRTLLDGDLLEAARAYARESGRCSFCSRCLTTPESLEHGWGPVCADKYGLPWG